MKRYVLPAVIKPILIAALVNIGNIILLISGFSFLGIEAQPNVAEWGMMLNDAKPYFRRILIGNVSRIIIFLCVY